MTKADDIAPKHRRMAAEPRHDFEHFKTVFAPPVVLNRPQEFVNASGGRAGLVGRFGHSTALSRSLLPKPRDAVPQARP